MFFAISSLIHERPFWPLADVKTIINLMVCWQILSSIWGILHGNIFLQQGRKNRTFPFRSLDVVLNRFLSQPGTLPNHCLCLSKLERQGCDSLMDCMVINLSNNCIRDKSRELYTIIKCCWQSAISLCECKTYGGNKYFPSNYSQ